MNEIDYENLSNETTEILRKYSFTAKQVNLFKELRKTFSQSDLNDFQMIQIICQKKSLSKCLENCKTYSEILKRYRFGSMKFSQESYNESKLLQKLFRSRFCYYFEESRSKKDDYGIFYMDYGRWSPTSSAHEREIIVRAFLILFEDFMRQDVRNVTLGVSFIMDWRLFGWSSLDIHLEKLFAEVFRYLPARLKGCYMYNCPWYIKAVMKIFKPFIPKKMGSRIHIVKKKEAIAFVGKEWFPAQLGGEYTFSYRKWVQDYFGFDPYPEKPKEEKNETSRSRYLREKREKSEKLVVEEEIEGEKEEKGKEKDVVE